MARSLIAYADGAIGDGSKCAGAGTLLLEAPDHILAWRNRRLERMTNNEAEYAGLLLALETACALQARRLHVYLDSMVVVGQMNGDCGVRSPALKRWHRAACRLARRIEQVTYHHIPRDDNRLADALANEALAGRVLRGP
jgi:ribonuclease HI